MKQCGRWLGAAMLLVVAARTALCEDDTIRLAQETVGTRWYGVYVANGKIGHRSVTTRFESNKQSAYVSKTTLVLRSRRGGRENSKTFETRLDFSPEPPYELVALTDTLKSKGQLLRQVTIRRASRGYERIEQRGVERSTTALKGFVFSLSDFLALRSWFVKDPSVGMALGHTDLSVKGLRKVRTRIVSIRQSMIDGVMTNLYDTRQKWGESEQETRAIFVGNGDALTLEAAGLVSYRLEPKDTAVKLDTLVDLFASFSLAVDKPLGPPRKVAYLRLAIKGKLASYLENAPGQRVEDGPTDMEKVVIVSPAEGPTIKATPEEIASCLKAADSVPAAEVLALARQAVGDAKEQAEKVRRLVKFVDEYIEDQHVNADVSVAQIIRIRRGDCTEHSQLLRHMAVSLGIPCRRVSGLMYSGDRFKTFGGHVWNEVVVDGVWWPVDPTWGETTINATHIRYPLDAPGAELTASIPESRASVLKVVRK